MRDSNNMANEQHLQIINSFSLVDVPKDLVVAAKIPDMIRDINAATGAMQSRSSKLEQLRQEKADGNFIGNWWHNREDHIRDAALDLGKSVGELTYKSSLLLVVNCAVSKVLNDQQNVLIEQQSLLKEQAQGLREQNIQILDQQHLLQEQQVEINAANKGLMEAKGVTLEQAKKLVGCVDRVEHVEQRVESAGKALRDDIQRQLLSSSEQVSRQVSTALAAQAQALHTSEQKTADANNVLRDSVQQQLQALSGQVASALDAQAQAALTQEKQAAEQARAAQAEMMEMQAGMKAVMLDEIAVLAKNQSELSASRATLHDQLGSLTASQEELLSARQQQVRDAQRYKIALGVLCLAMVLSITLQLLR